ncbi:hypothetical protein HOT99_gp148 [Caulobacter phage CcrBL10]|uniref:Uncharacterized protein n=1 Tax=Caulobacter phage CcrBL10 TaxID=2283269 RepID=A0A385ECP2_9CAUD|nr:hypothetical protein HOT99_gp148 [Caulobacter phage CcrBL10]AXQ68469.1 hypothetical protein CcrBL10_gp265 [Caulobacter phage CcrBL10]
MPHLSKQSYSFGYTSDALAAAGEFEALTTEFYRYETRYLYDASRAIVGVEVRVMDEDGFFVGYVAGEV